MNIRPLSTMRLLESNPFSNDDFTFQLPYHKRAMNYCKEIEFIIGRIQNKPDAERLKILTFLYYKCEDAIQQYSSLTGYKANYYPTDEEIELNAPNPYVEDFDEKLYEECLEIGYDKAIEKYENKFKDEITGYNTLSQTLEILSDRIVQENYLNRVISIALTGEETQNEIIYSPILLSIFKGEKRYIELLLKRVEEYNLAGSGIADELLALQDLKIVSNSFNQKLVHKEFKEMGVNVKGYKNFSKSLNRSRNEQVISRIEDIKKAYIEI